jgi:hypothetical protein
MQRGLLEGVRSINLPGVEVDSIECRASLCRLSVRYASANQPRSLFEAACMGPTSAWFNLHVGCHLTAPQGSEDGSGEVMLFAMRAEAPDGKPR